MTNKGIEHNLKETPWIVEMCGLRLHFSSRLYKEKFVDGFSEYKDKLLSRMYSALGQICTIDDRVVAVSFYGRIEKRGYLITTTNGIRKEVRERDGFMIRTIIS